MYVRQFFTFIPTSESWSKFMRWSIRSFRVPPGLTYGHLTVVRAPGLRNLNQRNTQILILSRKELKRRVRFREKIGFQEDFHIANSGIKN